MTTALQNTSKNTSSATGRYLDDLAHLIATNGIGQFESDVARLVVRLRSLGQTGPMTDLLADHAASDIARERAFGHLIGQLARGPAHERVLVGSAA